MPTGTGSTSGCLRRFDDAALSALHAHAFGTPYTGQPQPWGQRLTRHSLTWVAAFVDEVAAAGCQWLHVDHEPRLVGLYRGACDFRGTTASVLRLP